MKVLPEYPDFVRKVLKALLPFLISYLCESKYSVMAATETAKQATSEKHIAGDIEFHNS